MTNMTADQDNQQQNQQQQHGEEKVGESEEPDNEEPEAEDLEDGEYAGDRAQPGKKPVKRPPKISAEEQQYKMEFNMFDLDDSGFVDKAELKKWSMGIVPEGLLDKFIATIDTDRNGKISFNEYKTFRKLMPKFKKPANQGTAAATKK